MTHDASSASSVGVVEAAGAAQPTRQAAHLEVGEPAVTRSR